MKRAEDQMAGERRLDGDAGGFGITHFADHDDFGILAQQAAQPTREIKLRAGPRLRLAYALDCLLHRIFDGDDVPAAAAGMHQMAQAGVNGCRLAAAARSREQDGAGPLAHHADQHAEHVRRQAKLLQIQRPAGCIEKANDDAFALDRGEGAHAHVHAVAAGGLANASFLRNVETVSQQLGQHLEPGRHVGRQVAAQ